MQRFILISSTFLSMSSAREVNHISLLNIVLTFSISSHLKKFLQWSSSWWRKLRKLTLEQPLTMLSSWCLLTSMTLRCRPQRMPELFWEWTVFESSTSRWLLQLPTVLTRRLLVNGSLIFVEELSIIPSYNRGGYFQSEGHFWWYPSWSYRILEDFGWIWSTGMSFHLFLSILF